MRREDESLVDLRCLSTEWSHSLDEDETRDSRGAARRGYYAAVIVSVTDY